MSKNDDNLNGALTGIALAAATHWARYEDDSQRRLRNVRLDAEEALDLIRDMQSRGEVVRSRLPTVMDAQVGLGIASPQPAAAAVVPSTAPLTRPDLTAQMETAVADLAWPPAPGQYDDRGLVKQTGELTSLFLAVTYEEIRAFVQGLAQTRPPSREAKVQIFYAANALIAQLGEQRLSWQQCKAAWARLFGGTSVAPTAAPAPQPPADAHQDPARPPSVSAVGAGIGSVVPLSSTGLAGYPYANRNTDACMKFRIVVGNANVKAGSLVATIRFGTEYRARDAYGTLVPFQPNVLGPSAELGVLAIGSTSFSLQSLVELPAGATLDVFLCTVAGQPTE